MNIQPENFSSTVVNLTVDELRASLKKEAAEKEMSIENCLQCANSCEALIQHCLSLGGDHARPAHIRLLQDCADLCNLSAKFMSRDSEFHMKTCELCAEICLKCSNDCESMSKDSEMRECAKICRICADSCLHMARSH